MKRGFAVRESPYARGVFVFPGRLPAGLARELAASALPVPGYDSALPDPRVRGIVEDVLAKEKIRLADLLPRDRIEGTFGQNQNLAAGNPRRSGDALEHPLTQ